MNKDLDLCRRVIAASSNIDVVDNEGMSLIHVMFEEQSHRLPCFEYLVYLLFVDRMVSIPRKNWTLALHWAIRARDPAHIVRNLIAKDLSVWNAKDDRK